MLKADRIYRNATFLTLDSRASVVSALAQVGDRIAAVGTADELSALAGANTDIVDLGGRVVLPGFVDGHGHFAETGLSYATRLDLTAPPVGTVASLGDLLERLAVWVAKTPPGEWILGFGYDDTLLEEKRHPLAADLDKVAPDHPVALSHVSGHFLAVNSRAMVLAGLDSSTVDPRGGRLRRLPDGSPSGLLEEPAAMKLVEDLFPSLSDDIWRTAVTTASLRYASRGITTAQDGCTDEVSYRALKLALEAGDLKVRVQILPGSGRMDLSKLPTAQSGSPLAKDHRLSLGAVKLFADGSIQGYTGFLSNPYHRVLYDLPSFWRGYPLLEPCDLTEKVGQLHRQGFQLAVHGNGDAAIQNILDAFEDAQKSYPRANARHIVIHCQTVREDQLDRISRLGVVPSFFVVHTYYWGDRHASLFLGPERAARINPLNSAVRRRIFFSLHNDSPITPVDPLMCVWSAVNRKTSGGEVLGEDQRIDVLSALRSVTNWAAYQAHEEHLKGSLEPGKLCDLVVLSANPLAVPPESIKDIKVEATIVGGQTVFGL